MGRDSHGVYSERMKELHLSHETMRNVLRVGTQYVHPLTNMCESNKNFVLLSDPLVALGVMTLVNANPYRVFCRDCRKTIVFVKDATGKVHSEVQ